ncbi:MAG: hypothetical protein IJC24_06110 [Clostridia bacterium]|nr:hypothetical protein [Clostridia bacterium]
MKSNTAMVRCCRKKLRKGRSLFSQAVDYIALRGLTFMLCYMWFGANIQNDVAKILLSVITTVFISVSLDLINSLRLDSLIKKERAAAAQRELNRRISLLSDKERNVIIARHISANRESFGSDKLICHVGRASGVSADDIVKAARAARERGMSSAALFYSGELSAEARVAAYRLEDMPFEFIQIGTILSEDDLNHLTPTAEETDAIIVSQAEAEHLRRRAAMTSPFAAGHTRRYILCAACLTAMSFFVEFSLYFRLMAAACIMMAAAAWWVNKASA